MARGKRNKARQPKKSIGRRVEDNLNAIGSFGRTAVERPRDLPRHAEGVFRRWFRNVWAVRGGGLYAVGFAISFLYLETVEILTDDLPALFTTNLLSSEIISFIVSFVIDTFVNFVTALIWPALVAMFAPPWGAISLGVAFVAFFRFLKAPVERWLDREMDDVEGTDKPD